jgi:3' terminal RNA ribose 2'-O-methyltransferase Hen1
VLLTITSTAHPASDLGFLLHKHPERVQSFDISAGVARVFYPRADEESCTAALLLEIDPIALVRGSGQVLGQYVNDRPYAASSMLAVALGKVFRTAMAGRCSARPELVEQELPLRIEIPALPCRGGADLAARLFEPLGWTTHIETAPLDPQFPDWGDSPYLTVRLDGTLRLAEALNHLYVLLPVLDDGKHYWVSPDEVDKLIRAGAGWLAGHPERELITRRYLAHQRSLTQDALSRLADIDDAESFEKPERADESLAVQRRKAVAAAVRGAGRVVDIGCGEGALLAELLADPAITEIVGTDVSDRALRQAERRLSRQPDRIRDRARLFQSSLTYTDDRLAGFDAAVLMEVIEHVDPARLPAVQRSVFGAARPGKVVVTTPNSEHNVRYESLKDGFRHPDHRFEWTRAEFASWAAAVGERYEYEVAISFIGPDDPVVGAPTQMAVFTGVAR